MLSSLLLSGLSAASLAMAIPIKRQNIDDTVLQYALTLEHLEATFYAQALAKFDESAFTSAGYPVWVRQRVAQIGAHEAQHVAFLTSALGDAATKVCTYTFPYTDVNSFLGLASAIENVGVTAYLGAAKSITNPDYLTAAGSILTVEARHQAWLSSAALKMAPFNGPEDTPLGFSEVYSLVAPMIVSCPSTNPTLPVVAFPAATITETSYSAGDTVTLKFPTTGKEEALFVFYGLDVFMEPISSSLSVKIPSGLMGYAYGVISTAGSAADISDSNVVAGPIIMYFPFAAGAALETPSA